MIALAAELWCVSVHAELVGVHFSLAKAAGGMQ